MNAKTTLAMVIPSLHSGGAEKVFVTLANGFADLGYRVDVITFDANSEQDFFKLGANVSRHHLNVLQPSSNTGLGIINNAKRIIKLRRELLTISPNAVISFLTETNVIALFATIFSNLSTIVCEHTNPKLCPISLHWSVLRNITYRRCARLVVLSSDMVDFYPAQVQARAQVLANPIVLPQVKRQSHPKDPVRCVVSVGRLGEEKNHQSLINAFSEITGEFPTLSLKMVGDGPLKETLVAQCRHLNIVDKVHFTGVLADPWGAVVEDNPIFVLSSTFEGFPMALCEAMAIGLPVITTKYHVGVQDIIQDDVNGKLVPVANNHALADQLRTLLNNSEQRERLASNATSIIDKYGIKQILDQWQSLIAGVSNYD